MAIEFQIDATTIKQYLLFTVANSFPIVTDTVTLSDGPAYIIGAENFRMDLNAEENAVSTFLNNYIESNGSFVVGPSADLQIAKRRPEFTAWMDVRHASVAALQAANFDEPMSSTLPVFIKFVLDALVSSEGIPVLQPQLKLVAGQEILSADQVAALSKLIAGVAIPLDIQGALGGSQVVSIPRFINGGAALSSDGAVVAVRFEYGEPSLGQWTNFYAGNFSQFLANQQWALQLDSGLLTGPLQDQIANGLAAAASDFAVTEQPYTYWDPLYLANVGLPRIRTNLSGQVLDACPGVDLDVDVRINAALELSSLNTLRIDVNFDYTKDPWDTLACVLEVAFLWPWVGMAWTFEGKISWGLWMGGLIFGWLERFVAALGYVSTDAPLASANLADSLPKDFIKISDTEYELFIDLSAIGGVLSGLSLVWLNANDQGLVLGGTLATQQITLGKLSTQLQHGFEDWVDTTPCYDPTYENHAVVQLNAGPAASTISPRAVLLIQNDSLDQYSDYEYWLPYHPSGVPNGSIDVRLIGERPAFAALPTPYACEILLLSNIGGRWLRIDPPPALPSVPQPGTPPFYSREAWKIAHCILLTSIWSRLHVFNPHWLVDPPPELLNNIARYISLQVTGLKANDRVALQVGSALDVEGFADSLGRAGITSLQEGPVQTMSATLNDSKAMSDDEFAKAMAAFQTDPKQTLLGLQMRQVMLRKVADIKVGGDFRELRIVGDGARLLLLVATTTGLEAYAFTPSDGVRLAYQRRVVDMPGIAVSRGQPFLPLEEGLSAALIPWPMMRSAAAAAGNIADVTSSFTRDGIAYAVVDGAARPALDAAPQLVSIDVEGGKRLAVASRQALVLAGDTLTFFDLRDPLRPALAGTVAMPGIVDAGRAHMGYYSNSFWLKDRTGAYRVVQFDAPGRVHTVFQTPNQPWFAKAAVHGKYLARYDDRTTMVTVHRRIDASTGLARMAR